MIVWSPENFPGAPPHVPAICSEQLCQPYPALENTRTSSKSWKNKKIVFFSRFAAIYSEHQPLIKHEDMFEKKKTTWSYSILLCMKTVLQWFRGQSGTWWPRNQTLKHVRGGAFVLVSTGFNSLNTQKRTRTLTGTPIFIFSRSPVNYTSETP